MNQTWRRCGHCRTFILESDAACYVCGQAAPPGPGAPKIAGPPPVERQARKDLHAVVVVFGIIGILVVGRLLLATAWMGIEPLLGSLVSVAVVFGIVFGILLLVRRPQSQGDWGRLVLKSFAVIGGLAAGLIGAAVGLLLLLFALCAAGMLQVGG